MSNRTLRTPPRARDGFLAALERGLSVSGACKAAGMGRSTAYGLKTSDEAFASARDEAVDQGTDVLEDEAFRRACAGVEEPLVSGGRQVVDAEGKPIVVRRYSDSLMVTLLRPAGPSGSGSAARWRRRWRSRRIRGRPSARCWLRSRRRSGT